MVAEAGVDSNLIVNAIGTLAGLIMMTAMPLGPLRKISLTIFRARAPSGARAENRAG
jgi:hypothetical protein